MRVRGFAWCRCVPGVCAAVLAACGGGGGYNAPMMSPPPPPPAMPTASFTAPTQPSTVNFGQAVQLKWTSTNATSCTATTSATAGGSFSGTQSLSNQTGQMIVPTATGTYTYTLSCSGATGTTPASASVMVTVAPNLLATLAPNGPIPVVGSTVEPTNGDQNPYGLTIAPATAGLITKGDLIICNFNDVTTTANPTGVQGNGTTIIGLHPSTGSTPSQPYHIAQSAVLMGCNALTMLPDDSISVAAWNQGANPNALVSAAGSVQAPFASDNSKFNDPWGEAYVPAAGTQPAALYVSNAPDHNNVIQAGGTIDRISLNVDAQTSFTEIVTGFCTGGQPGVIFGPAGLTYDPASDTLYVIDTSSNSVIALTGVSSIQTDGVVVNGQCTATTPTPEPTFSGPSMASAKVIAHGPPLSAPLSAALLKNGDLVVGNADIAAPGGALPPSSTTNLLIEVSPWLPGGIVGQPLQVDAGGSGAIFGIAATVDAQQNQIIYFNDDNTPGTVNNFAGVGAVMRLGPVTSAPASPMPPGY